MEVEDRMAEVSAPRHVIGVDVGGTFTDAVLDDGDGHIVAAKSPSTPPDYSDGVMTALALLAEQLGEPLEAMLANTHHIAHGTTSSLNALVTGSVPDVGFLTTAGHRDSIYIMNVEGRYLGRSAHELQDVFAQTKGHALLPKQLALEVVERIDRDGKIVVALNEERARASIRELLDQGVAAIAVSLLWSFRNPVHEQRLRELIKLEAPDMFVALSSEVSPRIREYARHATTIMTAQVAPGLRQYLDRLETQLHAHDLAGPLLVMQANGGAVAAKAAPAAAISTVGSVLSGGVIGSVNLGAQLGHRNIIATDVGGTTFLVGLVIDGEPVRMSSTIINGHQVNVPSLKVDAIGSGGGAIAWVDRGGNLQVGPRSASASPGPACYGRGGTEPTNTDANLVLGILGETGLLGGRRPLSLELAREAIRKRLAEPMGMSIEDAAAAVYAIQNAQTADLLRKTVVEAGHDPRDFVLYAFGGAGPANCASYGAELGVASVVVPLGPVASAFSAFGLACSDIEVVAELSDPSFFPLEPNRVEANFVDLDKRVRSALSAQGLTFDDVDVRREVDVRYTAQLAELATMVDDGPIGEIEVQGVADRFESTYASLYGPEAGFRLAGMQAITYRAHGIGRLPFAPILPPIEAATGTDPSDALMGHRSVRLGLESRTETAIYDYAKLRHGHVLTGPAIIEVPTTTVVLPGGMSGTVDAVGNLVIDTKRRPA
jgi:N-methylhydantoinase A